MDERRGDEGRSTGERLSGCLQRTAFAAAIIVVVGFCAGSVALLAAMRSGRGQAFIVSWALVEGHDGVVVLLSDGLIEAEPMEWQHYRRKALALRRLGRLEESLAVYDAAIRALPDAWWPESHRCFYGALYGDPAIALEHCERAIVLGPDDADVAYFRRAFAKSLVGDLDGAAADLERSLEALEASRGEGRAARERMAEREAWLGVLRAGRNPFDDAMRSELSARFSGPREWVADGE